MFKLLEINCNNESITRMICVFVHQIFINRADTCFKALHYQGYSSFILPIVVNNIESMHIGIGLIAEIMKDSSDFAFALNFSACLCSRYPIEST